MNKAALVSHPALRLESPRDSEEQVSISEVNPPAYSLIADDNPPPGSPGFSEVQTVLVGTQVSGTNAGRKRLHARTRHPNGSNSPALPGSATIPSNGQPDYMQAGHKQRQLETALVDTQVQDGVVEHKAVLVQR